MKPSSRSPGATPTVIGPGTSVPGGLVVGPLSFADDTHGFGFYESGSDNVRHLVGTDDGGYTWREAPKTALPSIASTFEFVDSETGYAWGSGQVFVTHDAGNHWADSLQSADVVKAVSAIGNNVWAFTQSGIEQSTDGGAHWDRLTQPPLANLFDLSRVSAAVAYLAGCSQEEGCTPGLARTEDGGQSWQMVSLLPADLGDEVDLAAASTDDLWLVQFGEPATDESSKWIYRSYDGGDHWSLAAKNVLFGSETGTTGRIPARGDLGPLNVDASDPARAWLSFDRNGVWVTTDGGVDWQPAFNDQCTDACGPASVTFLGDGQHGWAATGQGLWRTTDGAHWADIAPAAAPAPS